MQVARGAGRSVSERAVAKVCDDACGLSQLTESPAC